MLRWFEYRELLWNLVARDLKARYKVSVLGFFWSLLRPLLTLAVLAVVFSMLFQLKLAREDEVYAVRYAVFLFAAYFPWFYFHSAVTDSTHALVTNAPLLRKVAFPRELLPLAAILANLINFLLGMLILLPLLFLLSSARPTALLALFVPLLLLQTLLIIGLGLLTALANVFYRDVGHVTEVVLMAWFYLTPVFYPLKWVRPMLVEAWPPLYALFLANPMTLIVSAWREVLLGSERVGEPALSTGMLLGGLGYVLVLALVLCALSTWAYRRVGGRISDRA